MSNKRHNWRSKNPMEMVNRMIGIFTLREIGPTKVNSIPDEGMRERFLVEMVHEDGTSEMVFDWDYILFTASDNELAALIGMFQKIIPQNTPKIITGEEDKPSQIIM